MTDNRFFLEELKRTPLERQRIELAERKGKGHPDSICDAVAEGPEGTENVPVSHSTACWSIS